MANNEILGNALEDIAAIARKSQDFAYRAGRASAALEIAAAVRDFVDRHSEPGSDWLAVYWELQDLVVELAEKIDSECEEAGGEA